MVKCITSVYIYNIRDVFQSVWYGTVKTFGLVVPWCVKSTVNQANGMPKYLETPNRATVFFVRTGWSSKWLDFSLGNCISSDWAFEPA